MKTISYKAKPMAILGILALFAIVAVTPHALAQQNPAGQGQQGGIPLGAPYNNPQAAQNTSSVQQPLPNPAGQGQQNGIPLGSSYNNPQAGQTAPSTQQQPLPNPAGQGQQNGIPLGAPYGQPNTPGYVNPDAGYGWSVGLAAAAIMSGVGVWSAVRRH